MGYIVTQMFHIEERLLRCIVFGYEARIYPVGEPLGTHGGCTWNFGAATLGHRKAALESGLVRLLMAWHAGRPVDHAFSAHTKAERLHAVLCIHTLKNPQGAVPNAQNGAFLNRSADTKQGLRKRSVQGFVAQPEPNPGRPAPQGSEMNAIITEGVANRTKCKQWQMGGYIRGTHHLQSQCHS